MFSVSELIAKYQHYTDEELFDVHQNISGYSSESQEALNAVIEQKGGFERLETALKEKQMLMTEAERIAAITKQLGNQGIGPAVIKDLTNSGILPKDKINEIIDSSYAEVKSEIEDKKIRPRTIFGSLAGIVIAAVTGGLLLGVFMVQTNRIMYLLIAIVALINYGVISLLTRQSKKNVVVLISTIISIIFSLAIAQFLYTIFGNIR